MQLDKNTSSHLIKVLRTKIDTNITLFNGDGYDYQCKTLDDNPKKTRLTVDSKIKNNAESCLNITLIQCLSRLDRMETSIQKSVELGVKRIIPVISQRSNTRLNDEKKIKKQEHWKKVTISACEQSGRSVIPEISDICLIADIPSLLIPPSLKILLDPETGLSLNDISSPNTKNSHENIEMLVGPEGGLTDDEIQKLQSHGFQSIRFGPRVLRTETAGPAVISALQLKWGDF